MIPEGYSALNIEPVGYHDLNGKPAFKLAMQELKSTAADLALAAAGHLLNAAMTSEDHRRLVTEFLDHFPERIEG